MQSKVYKYLELNTVKVIRIMTSTFNIVLFYEFIYNMSSSYMQLILFVIIFITNTKHYYYFNCLNKNLSEMS